MALTAVRVGELACQKNSFLRTLTGTVVSCTHVQAAPTSSKVKSKATHDGTPQYEIVLTDSVLFPEGGGQPCDHGTLTCPQTGQSVAITSVVRRGDTCLLYSPEALPEGAEVVQEVDWARRFDHMQHHTAQHLLSAIVEQPDMMRLDTVSWSLTHPFCFITVDLDAYIKDPASPYNAFITKEKKISDEMIASIQDACNAAIAGAEAVECDVFDSREAYMVAQEAKEKALEEEAAARAEQDGNGASGEIASERFRSRGIPEDVSGPIRIISIAKGDIDSGTCCGTHLTNVSQLHVLHLLHQETKNNTVKIYFVTGQRALRLFDAMYARERVLMKHLGGCRPEDFESTVLKRAKESTEMEKKMKRWTLELAAADTALLVAKVRSAVARDAGAMPTAATIRRDDVNGEYFTEVRRLLDEQGFAALVLIAAWAVPGTVAHAVSPTSHVSGQVAITGADKTSLEAVVTRVQALMAAGGLKGGLSKQGFRGKGELTEWAAVEKAFELL